MLLRRAPAPHVEVEAPMAARRRAIFCRGDGRENHLGRELSKSPRRRPEDRRSSLVNAWMLALGGGKEKILPSKS